MGEYPDKVSNYKPKTTEDIYRSMDELRSDLYYKDIVNANHDIIEKGTMHLIAEIMWNFKSHYLSKHEMFTELESLRSGYKVTDLLVKEALKESRKIYCKVKRKK